MFMISEICSLIFIISTFFANFAYYIYAAKNE